MIEQIDSAITFYGQFLVSGAAGTGLTITCAVYRGSDGVQLVAPTAATEIGSTGIYRYHYASPATADEYIAVFNEAAATADQTDVASLWAVSPKWVQNLGSAEVTTAGPVVTTADTLEIVRGDDYDADDGRAISFESDSWPDLTGATVTMTVRRRREAFISGSDPILFTKADETGTRVPGVGTQTIYFDLTPTETDTLLPGTLTGKYDVQAALSGGNIVTLITGLVSVTEDQTRA